MSIFAGSNPISAKVYSFVLTNAVTVSQGDAVCGDPATGKLVAASTADDSMIFVGFATRDAVGDGTTKIEVQLPAEVFLYTWGNDGTSSVSLAFTNAYIKDAQTVQADDTAHCLAGVVFEVSGSGASASITVASSPYLQVIPA